jgi:acetyltransferase-like isoleucine patch superfamily enzyme
MLAAVAVDLLGRLMLRIGRRLVATSDMTENLEPEPTLKMGAHSYGQPRVIRHEGDNAEVYIGAWCSIAEDVEIMVGGNHRLDWVSTFPLRVIFNLPGALKDGHPATKGDVRIGNDVWIGRGCRILSGVTIGDGAAIGAYSVVSRDVRPYAVAVGVPAREVRRRFTDDQVEALLRIRWWHWPTEKVVAEVGSLNGGPVDEFVTRFDPGIRR